MSLSCPRWSCVCVNLKEEKVKRGTAPLSRKESRVANLKQCSWLVEDWRDGGHLMIVGLSSRALSWATHHNVLFVWLCIPFNVSGWFHTRQCFLPFIHPLLFLRYLKQFVGRNNEPVLQTSPVKPSNGLFRSPITPLLSLIALSSADANQLTPPDPGFPLTFAAVFFSGETLVLWSQLRDRVLLS